MSKRKSTIPDYVLRRYAKRGRGFKAAKRTAIRKLQIVLSDLRAGCMWLPSSTTRVDIIQQQLEALRYECSIKMWGRG